MLDVAVAGETDSDGADLAVFVDRLAAAGDDRCTALARSQIRATIGAGAAPPGLRRLAEALAASVTELPPPRRPADEPVPLVEAMRGTALAVLPGAGAAAVAAAVGALVADGYRVVVTAAGQAALSEVRDALPAAAEPRSLDRIPALPPAELRELRRLLAASTPTRRARAQQQLPPPDALPAVAEVTDLCAVIARSAATPAPEGTALVTTLLDGLDPARRAAVVEQAGEVVRALADLPPRDEHPWAWRLLPELVHNSHRGSVDDLLDDASTAVAALDDARDAPAVAVAGRIPEHAVPALYRYLAFLDRGGRARAYFRSPAQREVEPVLSVVTVDGRRPDGAADVRRVIEHLEIGARLRRVDAHCADLGLRPPHTQGELVSLAADLAAVVDAARAVAALRHEVLFLAAHAPVPVPDLSSAMRVAVAIIGSDDRDAVVDAQRRLDRHADELARRTPAAATSPEHLRAVAALRERDAAGYAATIDGLAAVRREIRDESRCRALLRTLGEAAPRLAAAWADPSAGSSGVRDVGGRDVDSPDVDSPDVGAPDVGAPDAGGAAATATGPGSSAPFGLAAFVTIDRLLAALPPPDSADVVVVHGATGLGMERLLLAAVAPRLVATTGPDDRQDTGPSLLSVLRRAAAPVVAAPVVAAPSAGRFQEMP